MENLIEAIRNAVVADAGDDARKAGAHACRTILLALEAKPGEPLATAVELAAPSASVPPLAAMAGALRGMPPDQLIDLAIARLRAALPAGAPLPQVSPVRFSLVPVLATSPGSKR
ncbi:MAG: hypothetical protein M3619_33315 [Myxococcota bacterium]|nr:hypothetical protein [Myxococcota bacterium]